MKQVMVARPGSLEFADRPDPEVGPGDVRLRVTHSGLSSRSEIERYVRNPAGKPEPIGYNIVGVIEARGADVSTLRQGDRVFATLPHASVAVAPAANVFRVPDGVSDEAACFAYLPTLGTHALRLADYQPGQFVAISGQGIIGQTAGLMARLYGARTIAVDISDERLARAKRAGAHLTLNPQRDDLPAAIFAFCGKPGLDIVIDTASSWRSLAQSLDLIGPGGRVVMLGIIRDPLASEDASALFDAYRRNLHGKEGAIIGASNDPVDPDGALGLRFTRERNIEEVLSHCATGALDLDGLITHRYPIGDLERIYRLLLDGDRDHLGVVFTWPDAH